MITLIKNATIIDGKETPKYQGDVLINKNIIEKIGNFNQEDLDNIDEIINAEGLFLAPGFIDVHTHVDFGFFGEEFLKPLLTQGCTTALAGNCGLGLYPYNPKIKRLYDKISNFMGKLEIDEFKNINTYLSWVKALPKKINVGSLVPHGNIHVMAGGEKISPLETEELNMLCDVLDECLKKGFFGISFGLVYPPGSYLEIDSPELYKIGDIIAKNNGVLAAHIRDELSGVMKSAEEILKIGEKTQCSVQISHIKIANKFKWGQSREMLKMIEKYLEKGVNAHFDAYPYDISANMLATTLLPPEFLMEQENQIYDYLQLPEAKEKCYGYLIEKMDEIVKNMGGFIKFLFLFIPKKIAAKIVLKTIAKSLIILSAEKEPELTGKNLYQIAKERKKDILDTSFEMIINNKCQISIAPAVMSWEDIDNFIKHPHCILGSDLLIIPGLKAHPRAYGAFTGFLKRYVIEKKIISWESAIRKMSGLPAEKFNIEKRGIIEEGNFADLVLFDPNIVQDCALLIDSEKISKGIEYVFVNGGIAFQDGLVSENNCGEYILKSRD